MRAPASQELPPATTSTILTTSTEAAPVVTEPAPPTTAAVVPIAPTTTTEPRDTEPPILEITFPEEGAELAEKKITFAGVTEPRARVFAGKYEADVAKSGEWHIVLVLSEGKNTARFVARDPAGNESEASVTVYYAGPTTTTTITEPTTSTTEKQPAEFSAHASYGSCSTTPPFDVYYGTGEPGSLVQITSEYGSGPVEVGETANGRRRSSSRRHRPTPPSWCMSPTRTAGRPTSSSSIRPDRTPIPGGIEFTKPERPLYNRPSLTTSPGPIAQPG